MIDRPTFLEKVLPLVLTSMDTSMNKILSHIKVEDDIILLDKDEQMAPPQNRTLENSRPENFPNLI